MNNVAKIQIGQDTADERSNRQHTMKQFIGKYHFRIYSQTEYHALMPQMIDLTLGCPSGARELNSCATGLAPGFDLLIPCYLLLHKVRRPKAQLDWQPKTKVFRTTFKHKSAKSGLASSATKPAVYFIIWVFRRHWNMIQVSLRGSVSSSAGMSFSLPKLPLSELLLRFCRDPNNEWNMDFGVR